MLYLCLRAGSVAQWKSGGLISPRSLVRIQSLPPHIGKQASRPREVKAWLSLAPPPLKSYSPSPAGLFLSKGFQECVRNSGDLSCYPPLKTGKGAKVIVVHRLYPFPQGDCEPTAEHLATGILRWSPPIGALSVFHFLTARITDGAFPFWHYRPSLRVEASLIVLQIRLLGRNIPYVIIA